MTVDTPRLREKWLPWWPPVMLLGFFGLMIFRAERVEKHFADYVGCPGCFRWPSLGADGWLLAALAILLLAVVNLPWRWTSRLAGLAAASLLIVYIADLFVLALFGIRLFFVDLAIYGLEPAIIWEQFSAAMGGPWLAAAAAAVMFTACLLPALLPSPPGRTKRPINVLLIVALLAGAGLAAAPAAPEYGNNWIYRNVFEANLSSSESVRYSRQEADRRKHAWQAAFPHRCVETAPDRRNVIIVVVESWSAYQSQAFGGLFDWTPQLDAIARAHRRYTRFHAGGFSTNEGLVNVIGGVRLWAPFAHLFEAAEFGYAWGIAPSLASVFNRHGYRTGMLTTGPLDFLSKGEWFRDLGFVHVEGNEHPFYEDWPRIAFHAAADRALYERALQWIGESDEPYLAVLETVTTHQPYVDPESGARDMQAAFEYADRWAAWFYRQLRARGFFDDGVLLITSDHRSMNPLYPGERERFGLSASSRIPLILVDGRLQRGAVVDGIFKLSDILPSFRHRLDGSVCLDEFEASLFEEPPHKDNCAFHLRGSERGIVDVICAEGEGQVRLDGDATAFRSFDGLEESRRERILDAIAKDRLDGLRRHEETQ